VEWPGGCRRSKLNYLESQMAAWNWEPGNGQEPHDDLGEGQTDAAESRQTANLGGADATMRNSGNNV
jgi:hypothetical protein